MAILVLALGLVSAGLRRSPLFASLGHLSTELKAGCAEARKTASCQHRSTRIWYDPEARAIRSEDMELVLPNTLVIRLGDQNPADSSEETELFMFYPDGSADEQSLSLELGDEKLTLTLSALTGRLIAEKEDE